jgi:hypothetical protein
MKAVCVVLCLGMGCALLYSNRDELSQFARTLQVRERVQYVERAAAELWITEPGGRASYPAPGTVTAWEVDCREYLRQSREDSRARMAYDWAASQGLAPTGIHDIDEAQVASTRLDNMDRTFWPKRWRQKADEGDKWARETSDHDGPSEERVGASDSKSPAWAGKPLGVEEDEREEPRRGSGVSNGKAMSRFLFGTQDERM